MPLIVGEYDYYTIPEVCGKSEHFPRPGSLIFTDGIVVQIFVPIGCYEHRAHPCSTFPEQPCQHFMDN